mgnify:CR=1 FL=1
MRNEFERELEELNANLTKMAELCSESVQKSIRALQGQDKESAEEVRKTETSINDVDSLIEQQCIYLILKQQPVASDLRFVSAALRMSTDLERIGDQADDISSLALQMMELGYKKRDLGSLVEMAEVTSKMMVDSVQAFFSGDSDLAREAAERDDRVDELFVKVRDELVEEIRANTLPANHIIDELMVAKYLERIGDHAQNIGEAVVYSITGEVLKLQ